jgi:serine/threonine-protein kinase
LYFNVHLTALRRERIESTVFAQEFFKKELDYKPAGLVVLNDYRFPTEDQARKLIQDAGFEVSVVRDSTTKAKKGTVLDQSPQAGSKEDKGRTVTIVVSSFEPPSPSPSPTPSPSASGSPSPTPSPTSSPTPTPTP